MPELIWYIERGELKKFYKYSTAEKIVRKLKQIVEKLENWLKK